MEFFVKIFLVLMVAIFMSCDDLDLNKRSYSLYEEMKLEEKIKQEKLKQYADSTVSLSFKGIELGEPFLKTIKQAKKNGNIYNVKYDKDKISAICNAKIILPNREEALEVDVKIASHQDTITSFLILSTDYDTRETLKELYTSKYKEDYALIEDSSIIWTFKNQTLRFTKHITVEEEIYVKDPNMRAFQNRYGVEKKYYFKSISIIYTDLYHCKKVEAYEAEEARLRLIEERKKEIADSIKREEIKKRAKSQDI